ncbi:hypothetical protein N7G274_002863 [Stereocaulon virgatum]|uniref:Uncharacterized protein n=1 Tax=Stereocaulon virgatum TaxID=373712 RepID=A0ABR4AEH2_9LECA
MLCSNRPEGFGPRSHLYSHILTSCFLDTILVPLCTWLYILAIVVLTALGSRSPARGSRSSSRFFGASKAAEDGEIDGLPGREQSRRHGKIHVAFSMIYYLLILAQFLMCVLEIVRLALAHLGIGLLPFTFVTLILAGTLRLTRGVQGSVIGWRWANLAVFIALAITNGVKIAEEVKEGINQRKGTKYPESDEIIDVSVMIGVYAVLGLLEVLLRP